MVVEIQCVWTQPISMFSTQVPPPKVPDLWNRGMFTLWGALSNSPGVGLGIVFRGGGEDGVEVEIAGGPPGSCGPMQLRALRGG